MCSFQMLLVFIFARVIGNKQVSNKYTNCRISFYSCILIAYTHLCHMVIGALEPQRARQRQLFTPLVSWHRCVACVDSIRKEVGRRGRGRRRCFYRRHAMKNASSVGSESRAMVRPIYLTQVYPIGPPYMRTGDDMIHDL